MLARAADSGRDTDRALAVLLRRPVIATSLGVCGLAIILTSGCRSDAQADEIDLVASLPAAAMVVETRGIDIGEAWARKSMASGWWSRDEKDGSGASFAWSEGPTSSLVFDLVTVRDLTLVLDGRPFVFAGAPAQTVGVDLNGYRLAELTLASARHSYEVRAPKTSLRRGSNQLRFVYGRSDQPREVIPGGRDSRALGVAWYRVAIDGMDPAEPPRIRSSPRGALVLPTGSAVDFFLELAADSRLELDRWAFRGHGDAELLVEIEWENQPVRTVAALGTTGSATSIGLGHQSGLARVGLRVQAGSALTDAALVIDRPRLLVPAGSANGPPALPSAAGTAEEEAASGLPPNIIIYLIDTLRADRLGCYGRPRSISPRIDAFAQAAVRFDAAFAQSSWTRASVASLMTGLGPRDHGANRRDEALAEAAVTLAESLREAGYATAGLVTNPNVAAPFGFDQGFDHYVYLGETARADEVNEAAWRWLDQRGDDDRPFFLYLHTIDPHAPYDPPETARTAFAPNVSADLARDSLTVLDDLQAGRRPDTDALLADLGALYDAEIAHNDAAFGALLDGLWERHLLEGSVIALVSDHGEEFREHSNLQHGRALYIESLAVPFLLRLPGGTAGQTIETPVQHLDLHATILELAHARPTGHGLSLLPWLQGAPRATDRLIVSYLHLDGPRRIAIRQGGWSFLAQLDNGGGLILPRLFDTRTDPGETRDLNEKNNVRSGYLAARVRGLLALPRALDAQPARLDAELRESLKALGYLQ